MTEPTPAGKPGYNLFHSDADVFEVVCGRTFDDLFDTHTRALLVYTPGSDFMGSRARHTDHCNADSGLWAVHDTLGLGLGRVRVGLCTAVVPRERPHQTAGVSDF